MKIGFGDEAMDTAVWELKKSLEIVVGEQLPDAVLLSGGIDTSVLTALVVRWTKPLAITVGFQDAPDITYARRVAQLFQLEHVVVPLDWQRLYDALCETVFLLRTFDPMEVRNSAVVLIGLKVAKERGAHTVMTGDGGDELFAGYPFVFKQPLEDVKRCTQWLIEVMQFSSSVFAKRIGLSLIAPFTHDALKQFALTLPPQFLVGERDGRRVGKWLLRIAFADVLPPEIIWRKKYPIEVGSGSARLPDYFDGQVSDEEFERMQRDAAQEGVSLRSKEHGVYYRLYRQHFPSPYKEARTAIRCRGCGADRHGSYCRICGDYDAPSES